MARYTGPLTKKSRRLGTDLVGNDKSFERRPYPCLLYTSDAADE